MDVQSEENDGCLNNFIKNLVLKCKPKIILSRDTHYKMDNKSRGVAVIFNFEQFSQSYPILPVRDGSDADSAELSDTLHRFGFEVIQYNNLTKKAFEKKLTKISKRDHSNSDCLFIAILSHGMPEGFFTSDDTYRLNDLFPKFTPDICPSLLGKPKVFVIQASLAPGMDYKDIQVDSGRRNNNKNNLKTMLYPLAADFLIVHSTVEGYYPYGNGIYRAYFIQTLRDVLEKHWQEEDLISMLTIVNRNISYNNRTMPYLNDRLTEYGPEPIPSITSMLTKLVKFQIK